MIIGPKYKICKRLGGAVFEKCQTQKYALSEARRGRVRSGRRPGAMSDYKRQLLEKQKMRYTYGISERQLSRYVKESMSYSDPIATLMSRLESRLDNVVYRLGLTKTRRAARQMVSHGHIMINGRKTTIPSYQVREKDVISIRDGSKENGLYTTLTEEHEKAGIPSWLTFDLKKLSGSVSARPVYDPVESLFDPEQVLEYYSR